MGIKPNKVSEKVGCVFKPEDMGNESVLVLVDKKTRQIRQLN